MILPVLIALLLSAGFTAAESGGADFEASNILRYDEGHEVDPRLVDINFPDNTVARHFIENRLQMDLYWDRFRAGGRLLYFRPSDTDIEQYGVFDQSEIDKRYLEANIDPFRLRFGDFSDVWAHGLALSLFENRDLYYDSELDGVHLEMETGPLRLKALRGHSTEGVLVKEADVSAFRLHLGEVNGIGGSFVFIDSSASYLERNIGAVDWKFSRGAVSFFGERAWNEVVLVGKKARGHATYLGAVLSAHGWSLLLDYKDYDYGSFTPFQNPPTVYREIGPSLLQSREPHVLRISDEVGYQLELSGGLTDNTFAVLHYNLSSKHAEEQDGIPRPTLQEEDSPYWEAFASIDHRFPNDHYAFLEAGANEEASVFWQDRTWIQVRYSLPVREYKELEFEVEHLMITDHSGSEDKEFSDQLFAIGYDNGNNLSLAFQYQITGDEDLKDREGDGWPSAEAALTLGEGSHRMIFFYGRERGGLRCSNGVCRQVQAFSGFRLTLETSF